MGSRFENMTPRNMKQNCWPVEYDCLSCLTVKMWQSWMRITIYSFLGYLTIYIATETLCNGDWDGKQLVKDPLVV
jgi:hypothetical protein